MCFSKSKGYRERSAITTTHDGRPRTLIRMPSNFASEFLLLIIRVPPGIEIRVVAVVLVVPHHPEDRDRRGAVPPSFALPP